MRIAIFSDVHGNIIALCGQARLARMIQAAES